MPLSRVTNRLPHTCYTKCDNPVIGSTNDPYMLNPYRLTRAHCKCQWATNPESIPTPITQLEVYVLIVCLILGNQNFSAHTAGLLHPYITFRITPRVSYTHHKTFRIIPRVSYTQIPGFSPEEINESLLASPYTHYLPFKWIYTLVSLYLGLCPIFQAHDPFTNTGK